MKNFRPRFTDYTSLAAYLMAQPVGANKVHPLYTIGGDANDAAIIGYWGRNAAGTVAPIGPINFALVTPSQYGVVDSVTNPTTLVLVAGHNLTSGQVSALDATSGVEHFWDVAATVDTNTVTMTSTTGLASGDVIMKLGVSEFTIGNNTRHVQIVSGVTAFNSGVVTTNGISVTRVGTIGKAARDWAASINISYTRSSSADGQRILAGVYQTALLHCAVGVERVAGADWTKGSQGTLAALTATNNEATAGGPYPITSVNLYSSGAGGSMWTEGRGVTSDRKVFSTFTTAQPTGLVLIAKPAAAEVISLTMSSAVVL